jgi:hypothetical protein
MELNALDSQTRLTKQPCPVTQLSPGGPKACDANRFRGGTIIGLAVAVQ